MKFEKKEHEKQMMKPISVTLLLLSIAGCAEKKTRIWIEPPANYEVTRQSARKIQYSVVDIQSGRKEQLTIPLDQVPENLVIEEKKNPSHQKTEFASATKADELIRTGKLPERPNKQANLTISYLRELQEIETLYEKQQFSEAIVRLAPLIEEYTNQARLFAMQGTLYRKIGERKMALQAYKRAFELDQNNTQLEEAILKLEDEIGGGTL